MNTLKFLTLTLIASLAVGCGTNKTEKTGPTIIAGEVVGLDSASAKIVQLIPCDFIKLDGKQLFDLNQGKGKFHGTFSMTHPHDVRVVHGRNYINMMAGPGDSIFVSIDAKTGKAIFSGDRAEFNTQLQGAGQVSTDKLNQIFSLDIRGDVQSIIDQLEQKMEQIQDTLSVYAQSNPLGEDVRVFVLDDALFSFANMLAPYKMNESHSPEKRKAVTDSIFDIFNPSKAQSYMYGIHISNNLGSINFDDQIRELSTQEPLDFNKIAKARLDNITTMPKGLSRDIILALSMRRLSMAKNLGGFVFDYPEGYLSDTLYSNPLFLQMYVKEFFNPAPMQAIENPSTVAQLDYFSQGGTVQDLGEQNVIGYILEKHKGKVIYLDIWSTGCGPCIEEIEPAKELHKKYSDKDVAFVNLCMQSPKQTWEAMVCDRNITGENYYVGSDDAQKLIMHAYKSTGFPCYILIDKEGKVADYQALRPSHGEVTHRQIDELL